MGIVEIIWAHAIPIAFSLIENKMVEAFHEQFQLDWVDQIKRPGQEFC